MREDYATVPIRYGFNWDEIVGGIEGFRAYLVVFRSVRRENADVERLVSFDDLAHHEARGSEGFLHYFQGDVERDRFCLSFCLWESRPHAVTAARGAFHQLAISITEEMYETYDLERYDLYESGGCLVYRPVRPVSPVFALTADRS